MASQWVDASDIFSGIERHSVLFENITDHLIPNV